MGRAGGGVNALRGHANVQGITDQCAYSEVLPGYLSAVVGDAKVQAQVASLLGDAAKNMTPEQLFEGWQSAWKIFYSGSSILKRAPRVLTTSVFGLLAFLPVNLYQRRLTRLAHWYLQRRGWIGRPARFDVVAVDWLPACSPVVRHIPNAFPASGGW